MVKNLKVKIIFLLIAIFYAIGNFVWWKINTPIIPMAVSGVHFYDIFKDGYIYFNAPLITWIMKLIFYIFGKYYFDLQIIFVNYIFFIVALYFIYKLGKKLENTETGYISMILFALVPAVYGLSRQYGHQDYHVMSLIVVNIYFLIKTDYFKNRKWSIFYGLSVGLGLLIKDEFLAYFFVPWLYLAIKSLISDEKLKKLVNILITILIGSLIAGCHYFRLIIIFKILNEPLREVVPIFTLENLKLMTIGISEYLLSPSIFILFIISIIWFIFKYKNKNKLIILLCFFIPWLIIMFMPHIKEVEYMVGFIPFIIIIVSIWFSNIKNKNIKNILLIILIFIGIIQYVKFSYAKSMNNNLYFNKQLVSYNNDVKFILKFSKYIKNNFKNKKILLMNYPYFPSHDNSFDGMSLLNFLYTQNIKCDVEDKITKLDVNKYDIIFYIDKILNIEERKIKYLNALRFIYDGRIDYYNEEREIEDLDFINYANTMIDFDEYFVYTENVMRDNFVVFDKLTLYVNNQNDINIFVFKKKF